MPDKANQPHPNMCQDMIPSTSAEHQQIQVDEQMKRLVERLGELIGRTIAERHTTRPHKRS
jgi:hypothetical protein